MTNTLQFQTPMESCKTVQKPEPTDTNFYPLSDQEKRQLDTIINLFPNFESHGLGRTSLIKHSIDVGDAVPVKQRF